MPKFFTTSLRRDCKSTDSGPCEPGMIAKGCDPSAVSVGQKLDVIQRTSTAVETQQYVDPPVLFLVTVSKLDVSMWDMVGRFGELLQSDDWNIHRS